MKREPRDRRRVDLRARNVRVGVLVRDLAARADALSPARAPFSSRCAEAPGGSSPPGGARRRGDDDAPRRDLRARAAPARAGAPSAHAEHVAARRARGGRPRARARCCSSPSRTTRSSGAGESRSRTGRGIARDRIRTSARPVSRSRSSGALPCSIPISPAPASASNARRADRRRGASRSSWCSPRSRPRTRRSTDSG